jgi:hypothetical protein
VKNAFLMQLFCFVFVINGPSQTLSMNDSLIYQYEKTMVILRAGPCSSSHIKGYLFVRIDSIANKSDSVFFSVTLKDSLSYSNIIMACGTWEPNVREFHDNFVYVNDSFYLYSSFALLAHYDCINWSDVPIFELSKNIACQKIDTLMSNRKIIHLVDTNSYCLDTSYFYYGIGLVYSQHIGTWEWQSVTQLYELIKYNNHEFSTDSLGLHLPHVG